MKQLKTSSPPTASNVATLGPLRLVFFMHFPINIQGTTMEQSWVNNLGRTLGQPWVNLGATLGELWVWFE